jgi:hypothetical protein
MTPAMTRPTPIRPRGRRESGYALLMIFLLAAILALTLYQVMPRAAFESERDKEQLLIDRGEQYKRAIQLFYRKTGRYPVKMEDLESTNNIRFLRQRYKDPMTGKDEWRLIHVGPGGVFTDSLTQKKKTTTTQASAPNTFITELGPVGDTGAGSAQAINPGLRRRPSDGGGPGGGDPNSPFPPDPSMQNGGNGAGFNGGSFSNPGLPNSGQSSGALVADPGLNGPGNSVPPAGSLNAGSLNNDQNNPNSNPGALQPPSAGTNQNGTSAAAMIGQMLTGPRPGGPPPGIFQNNNSGGGDNGGFPIPSNPTQATPGGGALGNSIGTSAGGSGAGQVLAGSFAGVASTAESPSIKIYNDHQKYNEWEFIYDYSKDVAKAAGLAVNASGTGIGNGNNAGAAGSNAGTSGNGGSSFGNSFGSNNSNTTGGSTGGTSNSGTTSSPAPTNQ